MAVRLTRSCRWRLREAQDGSAALPTLAMIEERSRCKGEKIDEVTHKAILDAVGELQRAAGHPPRCRCGSTGSSSRTGREELRRRSRRRAGDWLA